MPMSLLDSMPPAPEWWNRQSRKDSPSPPAAPLASEQRGGIDISLQDRWLVLGTTGSGKTTFSKQLLAAMNRTYDGVPVYVLDSKMIGDFGGWPGVVTQEDPPPPIRSGVQIWQPVLDDFLRYDQWFSQILWSGRPSIVLVDEVSSVTKGTNTIPDGFKRLLKQGRGKNICVINCTQELAYNARQLSNQTTHIVRFRLVGNDQLMSNKLMGRDPHASEPRSKFGFFYGRTDRAGIIREYPSWREFLG